MGPLRQLSSQFVHKSYDNVTLCIDFREGGGNKASLHPMCNMIEDHGIPYIVREIKIGDYLFFLGNFVAPIIIERKSIDDVACSLADGRWERQQRNMRKAQFVLGGGSRRRCQVRKRRC